MSGSVLSKYLPWGLGFFALALPLVAWGQARSWHISLSSYAVFPLLGMWAWMVMWTHYAYGGLRLVYPSLERNTLYSKLSGWVVLGCILAHPGLLAIQQWQSVQELPPTSFINYVGQSMQPFVFFGTVSLIIFLAFDILRTKRHKSGKVKSSWRWVSLLQIMAMILIFVHAIKLGQHLQTDWMQLVWVACGCLLIPAGTLVVRNDFQDR
jgi:hypothetical protein